jgi:hypothetical protein
VKKLTWGQIAVVTVTTIPMAGVGIGGALGTYRNAASVLHRKETALGILAAGEGTTLVVALAMIVVTMFGQTTPRTLRAALWLLPVGAAVMGISIAPNFGEATIFAITPLAMTVSGESIGFIARRIVIYRSETDVEKQHRDDRRNARNAARNARRAARDAARLRDLNWHQARAQHHDDDRTRKRSRNAVWRLARRIATHDAELGSALAEVQRARIIEGADHALAALFGNAARDTAALPPAAVQPAATAEEEPDCDATPDGPGDTPDPAEDATPCDALPALPTRTSAAAQQPATTVHQRITPDLEAAIEDALRTVADDTDSIRLLTVAEVARQKGVTAGTVRSWVNRGKLTPAQRDADGRLRFHPNAVAELD